MQIALSDSAVKRIDKLRRGLNSNSSRVDVIELALVELERRAANFKTILQDDPINHDLGESDAMALALEAQRAVRARQR